MGFIHDLAGKVCEFILPIRHDVFIGNARSSIALCTLASMDLLLKISRSDIMEHVAIAGRLLSENKGIDALVRYVLANKRIRTIVITGNESRGHLPGQSLIALWLNGIHENGMIVGSRGSYPVLTVDRDDVEKFRVQIDIMVDMRGIKDLEKIRKCILAMEES